MKLTYFTVFLLAWAFSLPQAPGPIVHARLYSMAGCPNCVETMQTVIAPLQQTYGESFALEVIDLDTLEQVDDFYRMAAALGLSKEQTGVPLLLIGEHVLNGKEQIREKLPALVAEYYTLGGVEPAQIPALPPATADSPAPAPADLGLCRPETPCATPWPAWWPYIAFLALTLLVAAAWAAARRANMVK